ncbi:MAG: YitT family protein [Solobacterium sp.]|nr:YitT family protein [Solobacterium sp.]
MKKVKEYGAVVLGNMIAAVAVGWIILPQGFAVSGVTGLARLLSILLGIEITPIVTVLTVILFIIGFISFGKGFALRTFLSVVLYPALLGMAVKYPMLDALKADPLLSAILAGALLGAGNGIVLRNNASSCGLDILGLLAEKLTGIKPAIVICIIELCLISLQAMHCSMLELIYGILIIVICNYVLNRVLSYEKNEAKLIIFSEKYRELREELIAHYDVGLTSFEAVTGYKKKPIEALVTVVPYEKLSRIRRAVITIDPEAFYIIENVQAAYAGVYRMRAPLTSH